MSIFNSVYRKRKLSLKKRVENIEKEIQEGIEISMEVNGIYVNVKISHCDLAEAFFLHLKQAEKNASNKEGG